MLLTELHLTATECHLPYGITLTQVNTPALTPARQDGTRFTEG